MRDFLKVLLQRLPWVILMVVITWFFLFKNDDRSSEKVTEISATAVLTEIESLGKLELIKYNFQEVTEIKDPQKVFDFLEYLFPANKAVLISRGEAVGCIDLKNISEEDILIEDDTVYVNLPPAELCYFKVDLNNSKIYDLQTAFMSQEQSAKFTQLLYQKAEAQIKQAALTSGILESTENSAQLMLETLFNRVTQKPIVFTFKPEITIIPNDTLLLR